MAEAEITYIAILPVDNPTAALVKAVSDVIGKDAYQARLLLMGTSPRVVARCNGTKEAEITAKKLRDVGLTTIICPDEELRRPFRGIRAKTVEFKGREAAFVAEGGEFVSLGVGSVFLIIKGTRHPAPAVEEQMPAKRRMKLDVGKTILTGVPVPKFDKEKPKEMTPESEWYLRLYERNSAEPRVEMLQFDMDYSFLGEEQSMSSVANFIKIVKRIRDIYPKAVYDERMMKACTADVPMASAQENIDINCKLIYFQSLP